MSRQPKKPNITAKVWEKRLSDFDSNPTKYTSKGIGRADIQNADLDGLREIDFKVRGV